MADSSTTAIAANSSTPSIDHLVESLLRDDAGEIATYLATVERDVALADTRAKVHCHAIQLDGNGLPRIGDFARWLAFQVLDYAIPRSEVRQAREFDLAHNTTRRWTELVLKARHLFSDLQRSGEGGELLLYVLAQSQLGLPQLFCKMPHKTNPVMHYHGIDGIHVGVDAGSQRLCLYWGESKLHKTAGNAVSEALDSIKPYVCPTGGSASVYERDIQLMRDNLDLDDPALEEAVLRFLDRDDPLFNKVQFRGVCLVGFDHAAYPSTQNTKAMEALISDVRTAYQEWQSSLADKIKTRSPLADVHLEVFLVPFPSVQAFRDAFLKELGHG